MNVNAVEVLYAVCNTWLHSVPYTVEQCSRWGQRARCSWHFCFTVAGVRGHGDVMTLVHVAWSGEATLRDGGRRFADRVQHCGVEVGVRCRVTIDDCTLLITARISIRHGREVFK